MCKDLVTLCLTGNIVSDISDMGGAGLLDLASGNYSAELMAAYGLSDQMHLLPALKWSTDIVGGVTTSAASRTGLRAGTPVVAGLFDVISGAIGAGVTQVGQYMVHKKHTSFQ
jgi:L-xylulokinase